MRVVVAAAVLAALAGPATADETTGTIAAYDRLAHVIVFEDKTIWEFPGALELPADLKAGDKVKIMFTSTGEGVAKVQSVTRVEN